MVWNDKMYIFGGIFELTKELNDLVCFDFKTMKFSGNDEQPNKNASPSGDRTHAQQSPTRTAEEELVSPIKR